MRRGFAAAAVVLGAAWLSGCAAPGGNTAGPETGAPDPGPEAAGPATAARISTAYPAPPSTTIALADWGLAEPGPDPDPDPGPGLGRVRFGRLGLIHEPGGPRLEVYVLSETAPSAVPETVLARTPELDEGLAPVSEFRTNRNRLGGFFNTFARAPSEAAAEIGSDPDGRRALHLSWTRRDEGWCGLWVHLFRSDAPPRDRVYLDARPLATLSFWIRGARGGESIRLEVADEAWERRQDALPVESVAEFVEAGRITREWQLAVVPLDALPRRVAVGALATLVFEPAEEGEGEIWLGPMAFGVEGARPPPRPAVVAEPAAPPREGPTATWVWNTDDLLASRELRERLHAFLADAGVEVVFLQVPAPGPVEPLAALLSGLRARGVRVYALDGWAGYALPAHRAEALAVVDRVVRHNEAVPEDARFHGFRHDIEPYLLPGFHGLRRPALLTGFLELATESARRVRAAGMVYGLDIPFWYDSPGPVALEPVTVTWNGRRKPVSEHVIDLADDVAIMAYRTATWGADGTVAHAEGELAYAATRGTPVYVGLETAPLPDETLVELRGEPRREERGSTSDDPRVVVRARGDSARVSYLPPGMPLAPPRNGDPTTGLTWTVTRRIRVPASRLTFAELGAPALAAAMEQARIGLADHPSFAGFAIHHWESHRALLEEEGEGAPGGGSEGTSGGGSKGGSEGASGGASEGASAGPGGR